MKRPLIASPPWTTEEEEKLRTLAASGERPNAIAKELKRTEQAVRHRFYKLGIPLGIYRITDNRRSFEGVKK